jgi:D-alanine-D-alanine ligase
LKIAVLFGGDSMERDVSVASAAQVVAALRRRGHEVVAVDALSGALDASQESHALQPRIAPLPPDRTTRTGLARGLLDPEVLAADLVFIALHGTTGEDGTLQGLYDLAHVRYTGSGTLGSALGWDKDVAKRQFRAAGVPTPDWLMAPVTAEQVSETLGFPVIVKPNGQGSTVGLTMVSEPAGLADAIALASRFDDEVMIERYIAGRELTVGILDGQPLEVGEIIPVSGPIFDYAAKYQQGGAQEIFPAVITDEQRVAAQELGLAAHRCLKLASYSRVDFRMDEAGRLWCLEVNTLPGLSAGSLLPQSARACGISFEELCERIALGGSRRT